MTFEFIGAKDGFARAERGIRNLLIGVADSPSYQRYTIESPQGDVVIKLLVERLDPEGADRETAEKLRRLTYTIIVGTMARSASDEAAPGS